MEKDYRLSKENQYFSIQPFSTDHSSDRFVAHVFPLLDIVRVIGEAFAKIACK